MAKPKLRVVLDTNIYISALFFGGKPKQAVDLAAAGKKENEREYPSDETLGVPSHRDGYAVAEILGNVKSMSGRMK